VVSDAVKAFTAKIFPELAQTPLVSSRNAHRLREPRSAYEGCYKRAIGMKGSLLAANAIVKARGGVLSTLSGPRENRISEIIERSLEETGGARRYPGARRKKSTQKTKSGNLL
jgi:hypothetical protein